MGQQWLYHFIKCRSSTVVDADSNLVSLSAQGQVSTIRSGVPGGDGQGSGTVECQVRINIKQHGQSLV